MDDKLPIISYALAAMSGLFFIGGLALLSSERRQPEWIELKRSYPR